MNLTRATRYAVHALVFLASRPAGRPVRKIGRPVARPARFQ
jgi:DNA-binding IscR family transcriptional regulator